MIKFTPERDELLGCRCLSYQVQLLLPVGARSAFAKLSAQLRESVPSGLWIAPPESLHVTCYSLVSPRDNSYDKDKYWRRTSSLAVQSIKEVERQVPAFRLRFGAMRATSRAIVVLADDGPFVTAARAMFSARISPPGANPPQHHDTVHVSLCRYEDPTCIPSDLPLIVSGIQPDVRAEIDSLVLVRETIYPSLQAEKLMSASLVRSGTLGAGS